MNIIKRNSNFTKNETINTLKALLILSVILWHLLSSKNPLTKNIIYIFSVLTMPVFFGISGFLLKKELFTQPFVQLTIKYYKRLVIPFVISIFIYSILEGRVINPLYPWFHLWFIPAFLLMICYIYFIEFFNLNKVIIFLFLFLFTFVWSAFFIQGASSDFLYYLGDKRYYYYFVFLYFGYVLRNYSNEFKAPLWLVLTILTVSAFYLFFLNSTQVISYSYSLNFLLFNISLIFLVIYFSNHYTNIQIPIITKLGTITLPIYLWHIFPLLVMWKLREIYHISGLVYIGLYFTLLGVLVYLIVKTKETRFTKTFITGG